MNFPDTIYVIQHVAYEDLGSLEDTFYSLGFRVRYFEAGVEPLDKAFSHDGLTIILGGPIGINDMDDYPFLKDELDLLKVRLEKKRPTIGICLGAQLIAHALGAHVYAGHTKEIGWSTLSLTDPSLQTLKPLENIHVLHWHGDTFDLPDNATLLASSDLYPHQAFQIGHHILALQFHLEVSSDHLEKWLIGHYAELKTANIDIKLLRAQNQKYASILENKAQDVIQSFMKNLM